jgi:predicted metal-dependent hydrolase
MERLLLQHQAWFAKHMTRLEKRGLAIKPHNPQQHRRDYLLYKERARQLVQRRVTELNQRYEFLYKRIAIKNLRSKWASCSSKGNLNFHYQVVLLPDDLLDYLVVHELCHLQEQNHSVRFWTLVGQVIPDWRKKRLELKRWHPPSVS